MERIQCTTKPRPTSRILWKKYLKFVLKFSLFLLKFHFSTNRIRLSTRYAIPWIEVCFKNLRISSILAIWLCSAQGNTKWGNKNTFIRRTLRCVLVIGFVRSFSNFITFQKICSILNVRGIKILCVYFTNFFFVDFDDWQSRTWFSLKFIIEVLMKTYKCLLVFILRFIEMAANILKQHFETTTVHGFKYLVEKRNFSLK